MARVLDAGRAIVEVATRKNGSLSGEHGIGIVKRAFMPIMFNEAELSAMLDIKQVFDPRNLLNPGKIFPESSLPSPSVMRPGTRATQASPSVTQPGTRATQASPPPPTSTPAPTTVEEAARLLRDCTQAGRRGPITSRADAGYADGDLVLSTCAMNGILTYAPEDMYITVGAGTPLVEAQTFLRAQGQHLPLASPWPDDTIGGLVAANNNAPLRMRYGAIRDLVLCATVALADGRVIRAGRPVIKNVAGYDLVKLLVGSRGTLGLLTAITLKVSSLPRARRTLIIPIDDLRYGLMLARRLYPLSLVASAILLVESESIFQHTWETRNTIDGHRYALIYTAEGLVEDVQSELDLVHEELRAPETVGIDVPRVVEIESISGTDVWAHFLKTDAVHMRVGLPVRDLAAYVQDHMALLGSLPFLVDYASGFVYCLLSAQNQRSVANTLEQLRVHALQAGGYTIVTHMPEGWVERLDRWGYQPDLLDMMRRLKERWDPAGILNPGEFIM